MNLFEHTQNVGQRFFRIAMSASCLLALTACDPAGTYWESRQCSDFDHSALDDWSMGPVGVPLRYRASDGDVIEYELVSETSRGPSRQSDRFNPNSGYGPDDVSCYKQYTRTYQSVNADTQLVFRFSQQEHYKDQQDIDQDLNLMILVNHPIDNPETVPGSLRFDIQPGTSSLQDRFQVLEVGNSQYMNVIVDNHWQLHRRPPYGPPIGWPDEALIQVATLAQGTGLLQFEFLNGEVYTREDAINGF